MVTMDIGLSLELKANGVWKGLLLGVGRSNETRAG
jgi:hypothetical protein